MISLIFNEEKSFTQLLEHKADVNVQDIEGRTALIYDIIYNKENFFSRQLLKNKADINKQDKHGFTALFYAVIGRDFEIVKFLLDQGADVNLQDKKGKTAVDYAYEKKDNNIINLFKKSENIVFIFNNQVYCFDKININIDKTIYECEDNDILTENLSA